MNASNIFGGLMFAVCVGTRGVWGACSPRKMLNIARTEINSGALLALI